MTAAPLPCRPLGRTGLDVPVVALGGSAFGATVDGAGTTRIVHAAIDAGIRLFDTAPSYSDGLAESLLGKALAHHRDGVLVGTKFGARTRADAGRPTASRGQIRAELVASLRRLGTDHVDLYYQHAPDPETPMTEILATLGALVTEGKVRLAGCCNVSGDQIRVAADVAEAGGLRGFAVVQNEYNLLARKAETDSLPACAARGLGFLAYFPLAGGLLAGTCATPVAPERSTVARTSNRRHLSARTFAEVQAFQRSAARIGRSPVEVALAALLARPEVTGVLVGATSVRHVQQNAAAARWRPAAGELDELVPQRLAR